MTHTTARQLVLALRKKDPPLIVTDGVAEQWFNKFWGADDMQHVENAGHLESLYGERIRADARMEEQSGQTLAAWPRKELSVSAPPRVCQTWLSRDWSSTGGLYHPAAVEEQLGDRLRLPQYRQDFHSDDSAQRLSQVLSESQPPYKVSSAILRQWYTKYHPDSGSLRCSTAALQQLHGNPPAVLRQPCSSPAAVLKQSQRAALQQLHSSPMAARCHVFAAGSSVTPGCSVLTK